MVQTIGDNTPTWTSSLRYSSLDDENLPDFRIQKTNVRKRPLLMSGSSLSHETVAVAASIHNVLRCLGTSVRLPPTLQDITCFTRQGIQAWCKGKKKK